jgi:hypothetical protein
MDEPAGPEVYLLRDEASPRENVDLVSLLYSIKIVQLFNRPPAPDIEGRRSDLLSAITRSYIRNHRTVIDTVL